MDDEKRSLQEVVGETTYAVWTDMLGRLLPDGRSHRLAPVVAAMLQHAVKVALEQQEGDPKEHSVAHSLLHATELTDVDSVESEIGDVVKRLFDDAGVSFKRVSARGEQYSILEKMWYEFIYWYNMSWEP